VSKALEKGCGDGMCSCVIKSLPTGFGFEVDSVSLFCLVLISYRLIDGSLINEYL
jgi:hypothetical protein